MHTRRSLRSPRFGGVLLAVGLVLAACGGASDTPTAAPIPAPTETPAPAVEENPVTIRVVSSHPVDSFVMTGFPLWRELIEAAGVNITIDYVGGEEVIPNNELGEAVRIGAVDMIVSAAYHSSAVPEASAWTYSELTPVEELERDTVEVMSRIHEEKLNAKVIGRMVQHQFRLYLRDEISSIEDLAGLRLRGSGPMRPLVEALGAELVGMPPSEIFTSIERGLLDGFIWVSVGITDPGLHETVNYVVEEAFWTGSNVMYMNLDAWNSLSQVQQDAVMAASETVAGRLKDAEIEFAERERPILEASGIQTLDLGGTLRQLAFESVWADLASRLDNAAELEAIFRK